ncbi:unnamed protein product [Adineta ricciae]|uniref:Uncharacterized protein n=1 Tax=Adineta ricciae TaxID=249248 RepID=A0A816CNU6_ADIRI|nr:unnamed protein product [Adineta ricciae]CAF1623608.1 unnamed protein product [Adineta ricciae]
MDKSEVEHNVSMNDEEEEVNDGTVVNDVNTNNTQNGAKKLKSNTTNGATSTSRKHLIIEHGLMHLTLPSALRPKSSPNNSITRETKNRLDYLATVAIIEDGRTFGDLRKSGITKFLDEAISGEFFFDKYGAPKNQSSKASRIH